MLVNIKKCGNSPSVRIPLHIMQAAQLSVNQVIDIREEEGCIIIEPVKQSEYRLHSLLAGITDKNRHQAEDSGPAKGHEAW